MWDQPGDQGNLSTENNQKTINFDISRRSFLIGTGLTCIPLRNRMSANNGLINQKDQSQWPQFQFDSRNSGFNPNVIGPTDGVQQLWEPFTTSGEMMSPVVAGNRVFISSTDDYLNAIDANNGDLLWRFETESTIRIPATNESEGVIFVGESNGTLTALDTESGEILDTLDVGRGGRLPALLDNVLFLAGGEGPAQGDAVVAVDIKYLNDSVELTERWRVQTGECFGGGTFVSAAGESVYIHEDCGRVWALNKADGTVRWRFDDGSGRGTGSPPTIVDGVVYVGTSQAERTGPNDVIAINAKNGSEKWRTQLQGDIKSSPAIAGGRLFVGSLDGNIYALDTKNGDEIWRFETRDQVTASPAVVDGVVYIGSVDGHFYLIDASSGFELGRFDVGSPVNSSAAVTSGRVYVGGDDSNLYAFEKTEFEKRKDEKLIRAANIDDSLISEFNERRMVGATLNSISSSLHDHSISRDEATQAVERLIWAETVTEETLNGLGPAGESDRYLARDFTEIGLGLIVSFLLEKGITGAIDQAIPLEGWVDRITDVVLTSILWDEDAREMVRDEAEGIAQDLDDGIRNGSIPDGRELKTELGNRVESSDLIEQLSRANMEFIETDDNAEIISENGGFHEHRPDHPEDLHGNPWIDIQTALSFLNSQILTSDGLGLRGTESGARSARDRGLSDIENTFELADSVINDLENAIGDVRFFDALHELKIQIFEGEADSELAWSAVEVVVEVLRALLRAAHELLASLGGYEAVFDILDEHYTAVNGIVVGELIEPYESDAGFL